MFSEHPFCVDRSENGDVTIMTSLFDEEQIMKTYIKSRERDRS
jgi:hypothetical protein